MHRTLISLALASFLFASGCGGGDGGVTPGGESRIKTITTGPAFSGEDYLIQDYVVLLSFSADW